MSKNKLWLHHRSLQTIISYNTTKPPIIAKLPNLWGPQQKVLFPSLRKNTQLRLEVKFQSICHKQPAVKENLFVIVPVEQRFLSDRTGTHCGILVELDNLKSVAKVRFCRWSVKAITKLTHKVPKFFWCLTVRIWACDLDN